MSGAGPMPQALGWRASDARGPALGWTVSLAAHVLVVAWLWHAAAPLPAGTNAMPASEIAVRLVPLAAEVPLPAPLAHVPRASTLPAKPASRPTLPARHLGAHDTPVAPDRERAPALIAMPAAPASPVNVAGSVGGDAPTFDLATARATARGIAREEGKGLVAQSGRNGVAELKADHRLGDRLEGARRADCQSINGDSANLLANVARLAANVVKNAIDESGCKW